MLCSFSWSRLMPTYITTLAQVKKESVLTYRLENGHIRRPTKVCVKHGYTGCGSLHWIDECLRSYFYFDRDH
ncbi:hypothetical protein BS78_K079600 [Paspalum vaginatum]|uniref:Uncharacterized protein n=1 Tax=Paspalum vaginatum TaxID=158149 RepID=A0A9W8CCL8_9POAL|nr:hypothetical protein BS78_K207400 [Paspalum vaginatum]KAJ1256134.1 hypothetical protein BS78_K079600 [Paspalum vaginatum]